MKSNFFKRRRSLVSCSLFCEKNTQKKIIKTPVIIVYSVSFTVNYCAKLG